MSKNIRFRRRIASVRALSRLRRAAGRLREERDNLENDLINLAACVPRIVVLGEDLNMARRMAARILEWPLWQVRGDSAENANDGPKWVSSQDLDRANAMLALHRWIPVSEHLPEFEKPVEVAYTFLPGPEEQQHGRMKRCRADTGWVWAPVGIDTPEFEAAWDAFFAEHNVIVTHWREVVPAPPVACFRFPRIAFGAPTLPAASAFACA